MLRRLPARVAFAIHAANCTVCFSYAPAVPLLPQDVAEALVPSGPLLHGVIDHDDPVPLKQGIR